MKDVDHSCKTNSVDRPVRIAVFIIDDFQHGSATKTLQGFGARMLIAVLCIVDRKTMTRRTSSGNDRRSSRDEPIQIVGFCAIIRLKIQL